MKNKIFNAQEVQAIIAGNKTTFREVIKGNPISRVNLITGASFYDLSEAPYQVGQKIFVKEKFWVVADNKILNKSSIFYQADGKIFGIWTPAQHMKQEHSRLTLQIKEIRMERLGEISEENAITEGFKNTFVGFQHPVYNPGRTANQDFEIFWNKTHKKPEEKFEASPWVWKIDFEVVK